MILTVQASWAVGTGMESPAKSFGVGDNLKRKVQQLVIGMLDTRRRDAGRASSTVRSADILISYRT